MALTLELFKAGEPVDSIARKRDLTESTIETHLAQALESGERLDPRRLYTAAEEEEMRSALDGYDEPALKPVFEQLEGRISYGKLRLFRAVNGRATLVG
ncbi:MAG: hypothetical protein EOP87_17225 [Verrucomicrobiaceae bacterium]|nr:MAG: hypothetical protein EOP87_17225 [Verrucomicrobiaceae bacterium]